MIATDGLLKSLVHQYFTIQNSITTTLQERCVNSSACMPLRR
ncbi:MULTISPECIES: hypothetical protein [unclassified Tolypothrix]|nr:MULTISPECIES: hypothetical protein [unclassified Tolypothrix]EKF04275.1 hypothetical protein FDUTEX481_01953 [Tolypothrix sp. PCC 7601]